MPSSTCHDTRKLSIGHNVRLYLIPNFRALLVGVRKRDEFILSPLVSEEAETEGNLWYS